MLIGDAVLRLWATLPVSRRPVLWFEDAHWADEVTWGVLRRIVEQGPGAGVAVVVTTRPEGPFWVGTRRLVTSRRALELALTPLPATDVARMVEACLGVGAVPRDLLGQVAVADGRPLLVEELLADLARSGVLRRRAGTWVMDGNRSDVPASVQTGTQARLAALPATARRVVERAAVLGAVDSGLLGASFGMSDDDLASVVKQAVGAGMLEVVAGSGVPRFRHELVREAVVAAMVDVQRRGHAAALLDAFGDVADPNWVRAVADERIGQAAMLTAVLGDARTAAMLHLRHAERFAARGLPLAAAAAAERATAHPTVLFDALAVLVEALALAGEVHRALEAAARLQAGSDAVPAPEIWVAVVRAVAEQGDWDRAARMLEQARGPAEPAEVTALAALIALERGREETAEADAGRALAAGAAGAAACQAMEVLGRLRRATDLDAAERWFRRASAAAEVAGLSLWRARALHEEATIAQLRTLDTAPLVAARRAAVDAGAPGLVSAVDFHLSAVHGVRFESATALAAARRVVVDARTLGATRQEAWGWVLTGQAHAVGGARVQAEVAAEEAVRLAPDDLEIIGLAEAVCRGLAALLADDRDAGLAAHRRGVAALRAFRGRSPVSAWYLWPVLATVTDVEGDGGAAARAETAAPGFWGGTGPEGLWHLAAAVAAGRAGDAGAPRRAAARAEELLSAAPAFAGWRHLAVRWIVDDAVAAGWGTPGRWAGDAAAWFAEQGFAELAAACRGAARRAGVPQRRRGRGASVVPAHLAAWGVTSREVDVLRLVADGLTNAQIAERLYLSPRTVKGYVEQLLAKTGAANRVQLTSFLAER